jgi:hypothetical protein
MTTTVVIPGRFCGPPESANGGYAAGTLAGFVDPEPDADAVEVTLRRPPPLDRALVVDRHGSGATLRDGDTLVAEAVPGRVAVEVPAPVPFDLAVDLSRGSPFRDMTTHPFPTCFGCGPAREAGDGLRLFAGRVPESTRYAAPWVPRAVDRETVWAALDCPSCAVIYLDEDQPPPHVLGRMTARVDRLPEVGANHVVMSWLLGRDGRKVDSASAVFDEHGALCAVAVARWIALV